MELALEFGTPVEQLKRQMSERELSWWAKRSAKHWMPSQRMEWYLAQIAYLIAVTMGGAKDVSASDFMLTLEPKSVDDVVDEIEKSWPHP